MANETVSVHGPPGTRSSGYDLLGVARASQAISGELRTSDLLPLLMRTLVETAGATKGCLLFHANDELTLAAEGRAQAGTVSVTLPAGGPPGAEFLPLSILNHVRRSREKLVLSEATAATSFSGDEYFGRMRPQSIVCLPILRQTNLAGVLYLENDVAPNTFSSERLWALDLLVAQAAISLDNAKLYEKLTKENEERRRAQERFAKVFRASPAAMVVTRVEDGVWLDVNESELQQIGFTREEVLGRTARDLGLILSESSQTILGPMDRQQYLDAIAENGGIRNVEMQMRTKSGELRTVLATIEAIELDGDQCAIATAIDITERKRAEEALRESREELGAILSLMPVPMFLLEPATARVLFANTAAKSLAAGQFPKCSERDNVDWRAVRGEKLVDFETTWNATSGKRTLLVNSDTVRDKGGAPKTVVVALQDVTLMKEVEERLRQSQRMEALGRLAGGVAHDFNNLLTAIKGYSAMALTSLDPSHPIYEFLSEILKAGERASGLTGQLLAYGRKQVLAPKLWNLDAIVSEMDGMLERLIGEDVELEIILGSQAELVRVDRGQVEQVLLNLVVNARDAMIGGGRLRIETGVALLEDEHAHGDVLPGRYVTLSVSDTGKGMSPEVKARLFEPFFTTKDVGKGTGLGLSVVYGIVKQSGGGILVHSEEDRGSTFRICFPAAVSTGEAPESEAVVEQLPESCLGSETILLVEDDVLVRKVVMRALESRGYKVSTARNGQEALKLLDAAGHGIDLVLTDMVMPDVGGKELADRLAQDHPSLPVLFMSGYTEQPGIRDGVPGAEDRFLQKPFGVSELARKVRKALDGRHA